MNATSVPERQRVLQHAAAAEPEQQRRGQRADDLDRRIEHRVVEDRADVGLPVLALIVVELRRSSRASRRNSWTVDMPVMCSWRNALMRAIQQADVAVGLAHVDAEPLRDQHDQRQHRERDERQPPVEEQHRGHDADEREDVAEDRDDAGGEQLVERIDIGRDARHQPADRIAVVEPHVEPLQVRVDLHPQVEHDPLPGHLQRRSVWTNSSANSRDERREIQSATIAAGRDSRAAGM